MTPTIFSGTWATMAPAAGNHLWQSTLFAMIAGLLTLLLRKNHARARYWVWLAASLKFLVPFSLLIDLGSRLATHRVPAEAGAGFYWAIEQVGQPFNQPAPRLNIAATPTQVSSGWIDLLPMLFATAWLCGLVVVLLVWFVRWRQISVLVRKAEPLRAGREVEALRRLERLGGMPRRTAMLLSSGSLEPGIFGIASPVLLWPQGISQHLEDAHLEAILAHELWHVRRRDNLVAAMHMVVEAIFWFHPLVWWLGARLVEEREHACDEQVLECGSEPTVYAESILKTCEFCIEAPLACVSGVTGADLKKRVVRIMTQGLAKKLSVGKKLLLSATAAAAVAGPVIFGLLHAPQVRAQSPLSGTPLFSFDVASIKPDHLDGHHTRVSFHSDSLIVTGMSLKRLIQLAYHVDDFQISGGPAWVDSETYEMQAKMDESTLEALKKLPRVQRAEQEQLMIQSLLAERFKLKLSHSSKELPIFALVLIKGGPKFSQWAASDGSQNVSSNNGDVTVKATISHFAEWLSSIVGRKVVDQTGLQGWYDFHLNYNSRRQELMAADAAGGNQGPDSSAPSIFTALQEQLGLKLESKKGPVDTLMIDSAEKPSPN